MRSYDPAEQAANFARLEACTAPAHDFRYIFEVGDPKPVSGRCCFCGGTVSRSSMNWFARGLAAGAANPDAARAVLPPWLRT